MSISATSGTWTIGWPYPRIFFLSEYVLAVTVDSGTVKFYEVTKAGTVWTMTFIANFTTTANVNTIEVIDFGPYYVIIAANTAATPMAAVGYVRDVSVAPGTSADVALPTTNVPEFVTGCNFNGQLVVGGITTSLTYGTGWVNLGASHLAWSAIGNVTFKPDENPTAGFAKFPFGGNVLSVRKCGGKVLALGSLGRVMMTPGMVGDSFTYGLAQLDGPGITHGHHVAGDGNLVGFMDAEKEFWIASEKQVQKLGYKEFLTTLTNASVIVTYVPQKKRFFISDGVKGFCLTENGLYSTNQLVTSAGVFNGTFYGFWGNSADYELRLETAESDFGQRGLKTLQGIETDAEYVKSSGRLQTSVKFKSSHMTQTYAQSGWIYLNDEGAASPIVTASDLKICLKGSDYRSSSARISRLTAKLKMSDKRFLRGLNVNKTLSNPG